MRKESVKNYYIGNYVSSAAAVAIESSKKDKKWQKRTATAALVFSLNYYAPRLNAATIEVNATTVSNSGSDGICDFEEAVLSAKNDDNSHDGNCTAGNGDDVIIFKSTLSGSIYTGGNSVDNSKLTINGSSNPNVSLQLGSGSNSLFDIGSGDLTLNDIDITVFDNTSTVVNTGILYAVDSNLTLKNVNISGYGLVDAGGSKGAVYSNNSYVKISDSNISGISLSGISKGAVVHSINGSRVVISDSNISKNRATAKGGAFYLTEDSNITISNSNITGNSSSGKGGAIYLKDSNATLYYATVKNNKAEYHGGAIHLNYDSNITIKNSDIVYNTSVQNDGGGMYTLRSHATIKDSNISENYANFDGGGVDVNSSNITIADSSLSTNTAGNDGGSISAEDSNVTISNSVISNSYSNYFGGGVSVRGSYSNLKISDSTIMNNSAGYGAGVYTFYPYSVTIENSTISGNSAGHTSGGFWGRYGLYLTIANSTISYNTAQYRGAGVYLKDQNTIEGTIYNSDIKDNYLGLGTTSYGGAGIFMATSKLKIKNSRVSGNFIIDGGTNLGAGVYVNRGELTLKDSNITGNKGYASVSDVGNTVNGTVKGAGIAIESSEHNSTLVLDNAQVTGNETTSYGGGIYTAVFADLNISDSNVSSNKAKTGGGIYAYSSTVYIEDSVVSGNSATFTAGGIKSFYGNLHIKDTTISYNSAGSQGGGIYNYSSSLSVENSTISGNSAAQNGGGVYLHDQSGSSYDINITNTTISENTSGDSGGGINARLYDSDLGILNATIAFNSATVNGGGAVIRLLANGGSNDYINSTVHNSIFSNNSPYDLNVTIGDSNYVSLRGDRNTILSADPDEISSLDDTNSTDPGLTATLADNGGKTKTHALTFSIEGNATAASHLLYDQRGFIRDIDGNGIDIGAFEFVSYGAEISLDIEDLNVTNRNITGITYKGVDGNDEDFVIAGTESLATGDNNVSIQVMNPHEDYVLIFTLDSSNNYIFNFDESKLYAYDISYESNSSFIRTATHSDSYYVDASNGANWISANAPVLSISNSFTVAEGTAASLAFAVASATDADGDTITFNLAGTHATTFNIDSSSGAISFVSAAVAGVYNFDVNASDGYNSDTVSVTVEAIASSTLDFAVNFNPTETTEVTIKAVDVNGTSTTIESVNNFSGNGTASILIPYNMEYYYISYELNTSEDYIRNGYYSATGPVYDLNETDIIETTSNASKSLDLDPGYVISGTLTGYGAIKEGHGYPLRMDGDILNYEGDVNSSDEYMLRVPEGDYKIKMFVESTGGNKTRDYYTSAGLVKLTSLADTVTVDSNKTIDFALSGYTGHNTVSFSTGWNLMSIAAKGIYDASDLHMIFEDSGMSHIVKYDPIIGWSYFWEDESVKDDEFNQFSELKSTEGFWLYSTTSGSIDFPLTGLESSYSSELHGRIESGWNLLGFPYIKTAAQAVSAVEAGGKTVKALWLYSSGSWKAYYPHTSEVTSTLNATDNVLCSDGFWVLVE